MAAAPKTIRVTVDLPEELHLAFRMHCLVEKTTMQQRLIELIRREVEPAKPKAHK